MSIDMKALRALLAKTHLTDLRWSDEYPNASGGETWSLLSNGDFGYGVLSCDEDNAPDEDRREVIAAGLNALPALLDLADAARELNSVIARVADPTDASIDVTNSEYEAARRVLAILESK